MTIQELQQLIATRESERLEFKQWRDSVSFDGQKKFENRRCLLGYCVAIGNEGGGYLIIGVDNNGCIIGTGATLSNDFSKKIYDETGQKVEAEEVRDENSHRVLVVHIPPRPLGTLLKFAGVPLMRVGDSLEVMSDEEQRKALLEAQDDFSAEICPESSPQDIDVDALSATRGFYSEKNPGNAGIATESDDRFLTDLTLLRDDKLTYAGVILLAKKEFLDRHLAQAEISFEYRNNASDIQYVERIDFREPFILSIQKIWDKILSRQQIHQVQEGLFRADIPAYDEEVFREALFNAVCHRDYRQQGSVFIKQSPQCLEITNPGGFPNGVTAENIITFPATPRNRFLAESFQKIFRAVERSGQGADKIFRRTIEEGKGTPDYSASDASHVALKIPAMLEDGEFVQFLDKVTKEKHIALQSTDYVLLDAIRQGKTLPKETIEHLIEMRLLEAHGKTRGTRYILSSEFYNFSHQSGTRTRRIGLSRDYKKGLIIEHLRRHKTGTMEEFRQVLPDTRTIDITTMLAELKRAGVIKIARGKTRSALWSITKDYE